MQKSESIGNLVAALKTAQAEFAPILKTSENPGFKKDGKASKYADLATAIEATQPSLIKNCLVVMQFPVNGMVDRIGVRSILAHTSGEFISEEFWLPLAKNDAQTGVAAVTYARRASYLGIIGAAAEDDDGNTVAGRTVPPALTAQNAATITKATVAPKAEIPAALPSSGESVATPAAPPSSGSPEVPFTEYRKMLTALCEELGKAGLKFSKGLPINRKVLTYVLSVTGASKIEDVTGAQFQSFFSVVDAVRKSEAGIKQMIPVINGANNLKEEVAK